jgi:rhodanese-related sulfurtransferase
MPAQLISPRDAADRVKSAPGRFIDVRTPPEYAEVHADGTASMPLDSLDPAAVAKLVGSHDQPVYVICRSGGRAAKACDKLAAAGFTQVYNVEGGTAAWDAAGLPVVRGRAKVISLERQVRIAAGALVLTGVILGWFVHRGFLGISAFVGAGLVFAGVTDWCGMGLLIAKAPWNRRA